MKKFLIIALASLSALYAAAQSNVVYISKYLRINAGVFQYDSSGTWINVSSRNYAQSVGGGSATVDTTSLSDRINQKVTANSSITGATKAKITYDSKGLVTGGADLVEGDVPALPLSKVTGLLDSVLKKQDRISYTFQQFGVLPTNSASVNKTKLQAAINYLTSIGGGYLTFDFNCPIEGPIAPKDNVHIRGNLPSNFKGTGGRTGSYFVVTNTTTNLFLFSGVANWSLEDFGIDYPNQPLTTSTPSTSLIQYPTTIKGTDNIYDGTIRNIHIVGAWTMIELGASGTVADVMIDRIYGYPLSGRGIYINNCSDISKITNCMFSPSVGNYYRPAGNVASICHSTQVMMYVMDRPNSFIEIAYADEMFITSNFAFAYPTFIKVQNAYASIFQCAGDIGKIGLDLDCQSDHKQINVVGLSIIGSGGTNASERDHIIIRSIGRYKFYDISPKLGISPFGIQGGNPNNNSVFNIASADAKVEIYGCTGTNISGTYFYDIANPYNASLKVYNLDIPSATVKWNGTRNEDNVSPIYKGLKLTGLPSSGIRPLAADATGNVMVYDPTQAYEDVLSAEFNGSSGTALSAYTPEVGTITSYGGSLTLAGDGSVSMTEAGSITKDVDSSKPTKVVLSFMPAANDFPRMFFNKAGGGYVQAQLNIDPVGTSGQLYILDGASVVATSSFVGIEGSYALTAEYNNGTFTFSINNTANTSISYTSSGSVNQVVVGSGQGTYALLKLVVSQVTAVQDGTFQSITDNGKTTTNDIFLLGNPGLLGFIDPAKRMLIGGYDGVTEQGAYFQFFGKNVASGNGGSASVVLNSSGVNSSPYFKIYNSTGSTYNTLMNLTPTALSFAPLAGTGTRMMVTDASGNVSTQAIPSGSGTTPTIQQVLDAGKTSTTNMFINGNPGVLGFSDAAKRLINGGYDPTVGELGAYGQYFGKNFSSANGGSVAFTLNSTGLNATPFFRIENSNGSAWPTLFEVNTSGAKIPVVTGGGSGKFLAIASDGSLSAATPSGGGSNHAVSDGNYTVLSTDKTILLPDPAATRTLTLPAASTMQNQTIKIVNFANATGEWVLSGSFIQLGKTGTMTEDFINSGLATGTIILESSDVGSGTWKWVQVK